MRLYIGGFGLLWVSQLVTLPHGKSLTIRKGAVDGDIAVKRLHTLQSLLLR